MQYYNDGQCRFISNTTGPVAVGKTLETNQPHVTVFSMCRPLLSLEKVIELDETGRVTCKRCGLESYDVLSASLMIYRTRNPRSPPPVARPLPQPPPGGQRKRRRSTSKEPELPDADVKQLPSTKFVEEEATQPHKGLDEEMRPGYQPQQQDEEMRPGYQPHQKDEEMRPGYQPHQKDEDMRKGYVSNTTAAPSEETMQPGGTGGFG